MAWGRPAEQEAKCNAGNQSAKNWQDEAQKILEGMVCAHPLVNVTYLTCIYIIDGVLLQESAKHKPVADSESFPHR
jgi:hypothetical protein